MIDASPIAAPSKGVPNIFSACVRMDMWGLSEVAKALCGATFCYENCAVGTCIKSQGRRVCSCFLLSTVRKEMKSTTIETKIEIDIQKSFFQFPLLFTPISSLRISCKSLTSQPSRLKKMI